MKSSVNFAINSAVKGKNVKGDLVINPNKALTIRNSKAVIKQNMINNYYIEMNLLKVKCIEKLVNTYNVSNNNVKYLVMMACHCNTEYKLLTIKQNIKYLMNDSTELLLINSSNLIYNGQLKEYCASHSSITYIEMLNDNTYDFGKWIFGLKNINYSKYNFVIFTNDSFIIHTPIDHYFNLIYKNNVELYGYNNSTQRRYHYQSYLFSVKRESISKFINNFNIRRGYIRSENSDDVITHYELTMTDWFTNKNCFLNIANIPSNINGNIFFTNNSLYDKLKKTNLLPFTKIKSISSTIVNNTANFIKTYIYANLPINKYENNTVPCIEVETPMEDNQETVVDIPLEDNQETVVDIPLEDS